MDDDASLQGLNSSYMPLLRNTISKFHTTFTPYGSLFILCILLPNLGIQTTNMCIAQLMTLLSM